ncbi:hypothetical protein BDV95DRAFT_607487 [Massariosphaeria phaeospora]|uniref:BZIP domain-containing protein n=1 Tax=Massariosphaeria phaeospora TaxID=100035 RepID=A0A7C8M9C2_9PLEO|nr:hypothetical protein BDV95DRAFT_607487 [Massariosphaeria phaeospora]
MSSKSDDTPASIRIRENQRRSRARRKELVSDLQKRVDTYQLKGVAATQEMQRAARVVVRENVRLRNLLARYGASQQEVDRHLRSFNDVDAINGGAASNTVNVMALIQNAAVENALDPLLDTAPACTQGHHLGEKMANADQVSSVDQSNSSPLHTPERDPTPALFDVRPIERDSTPRAGIQFEPPVTKVADSPSDAQAHREASTCTPSAVEKLGSCTNTVDCFCPPTTIARREPSASGLEISCETAAAIIAEMRGDGDRDSIRTSLGCNGPGDCTIKNSTVLQIMDER